jgi:hypothetical protein
MQDRESQSDVNPGMVEQRLDEAPVEREGVSAAGVEREGMQGGEAEREELRAGPTERQHEDGGEITQRDAIDGPDQADREDVLDGSH